MLRTASLLLVILLGPTASAQQATSTPTPKPLREAVHEAAAVASTPAEVADALVRAVASALVEEAELTASDAGAGDFFGASVSLDGDRALVGASRDDTDAGNSAGSAYVFVRSGTTWTEEAKLTASDAAEFDFFGSSVSLSGDRALVGARRDDTDAGNSAGSAYVFVRSGSTWTEEAKLTASDAATDDFFGSSVSLDGDRALVGAVLDDTVAGTDAGSAYVFVRSGTTWTEEAKITASDAAEGDFFGSSVSLNGDRALIGAAYDDTAASDAGSAYVFVRSGSTWSEEAKLMASDAEGEDFFGSSVSLDGDRALVGATLDDTAAGIDAGSAYVFVRSGTTWTEEAKLTASDGAASENFGSSVSLDGDRALVGAANGNTEAGKDTGSAYIFVHTGATWSEEAKLAASDAAKGDFFGRAVSLDGERALVGAALNDTDAGTDAGSAYLFGLTAVAAEGTPATQRLRLDAPFPNPARGHSTVRYALDEAAEVHLALYDVLGREVAVLASGSRAVGSHEARLTTERFPAGLYVLRLTAGSERATRNVVLLK